LIRAADIKAKGNYLKIVAFIIYGDFG